ncbi:Smt3-specific protease, partial [Ascosphaera acerosa]
GFELDFDGGLTKAEHDDLRQPRSWLSDAQVYAYLSLLCRAGNHHRPEYYGIVPPAFVHQLLFPHDGVNLGELPGYQQVVSVASRAYIVFFPLMVGSNHWALLACSPLAQRCVVLDSRKPCRGAARYMDRVEQWLVEIHALPPCLPLRRAPNTSPCQQNNFDCGMFVCANARVIVDAASLEIQPTFRQRDVVRFRAQVTAGLRLGRIVPPVRDIKGCQGDLLLDEVRPGDGARGQDCIDEDWIFDEAEGDE